MLNEGTNYISPSVYPTGYTQSCVYTVGTFDETICQVSVLYMYRSTILTTLQSNLRNVPLLVRGINDIWWFLWPPEVPTRRR